MVGIALGRWRGFIERFLGLPLVVGADLGDGPVLFPCDRFGGLFKEFAGRLLGQRFFFGHRVFLEKMEMAPGVSSGRKRMPFQHSMCQSGCDRREDREMNWYGVCGFGGMNPTLSSTPLHEDAPLLFHRPDNEQDAAIVSFLDELGFVYRERAVQASEVRAQGLDAPENAGLPALVWSDRIYPDLSLEKVEDILHHRGFQFEDS